MRSNYEWVYIYYVLTHNNYSVQPHQLILLVNCQDINFVDIIDIKGKLIKFKIIIITTGKITVHCTAHMNLNFDLYPGLARVR